MYELVEMEILMKKATLIVLCLISFSVLDSYGQSYGTNLGLRFGNSKDKRTVGLTMEQRILKHTTLEAIAQTDLRDNHTFHGLIKAHHGFLTKRFNIFAGTGISFGVEESLVKNDETKEITRTFGNATLGADIILGVEFTLLRYNFSLDYKPNFNLVGRENWYQGQTGVSIRSVIVKGSTQKKRKRKRAKAKKKREKERAKEKTQKSST